MTNKYHVFNPFSHIFPHRKVLPSAGLDEHGRALQSQNGYVIWESDRGKDSRNGRTNIRAALGKADRRMKSEKFLRIILEIMIVTNSTTAMAASTDMAARSDFVSRIAFDLTSRVSCASPRNLDSTLLASGVYMSTRQWQHPARAMPLLQTITSPHR